MSAYVPSLTETDTKKQNRSLQGLAQGRSNATGTVTLAVSATSTTVTDTHCATGSVVKLTPATADAAAVVFFIPVATVTNGSFVIQHPSAASTDRTFSYAIQG